MTKRNSWSKGFIDFIHEIYNAYETGLLKEEEAIKLLSILQVAIDCLIDTLKERIREARE